MLSVQDIIGRLFGEPSASSIWAGTPRFRCCGACSVELSSLGAMQGHRARCRWYYLTETPDYIAGARISDDESYERRHEGCVCQYGASDEL